MSLDVFRLECERVLRPSWCCVGRSDAIGAEAGSYQLVDVQGDGIVVVRGDEGELRAFANVCRHRGAELIDSTDPATRCGALAGRFRCPYHSWTYGLDGAVQSRPYVARTDAAGLDLHTVELDEWGGFVFLRRSTGDGRSLIETLGAEARRIRNYPLVDLAVGHSIAYDVRANWKVLAENYNECYHCGPVHPELCEIVPSFRRGGGTGLDWERGIPHRAGADTFTFSGTTRRASLPGLDDDELVNHKGELLYPNLWLSLSRDHVAAFTSWPLAPDHTRVVCDFLFHPDEIARADFDPMDAVEFWDTVNRQDWAICERVQRGMTSRWFTAGHYAPMEDPSLDIRRWWSERMGDWPQPH